jgi:hypothetical protein
MLEKVGQVRALNGPMGEAGTGVVLGRASRRCRSTPVGVIRQETDADCF